MIDLENQAEALRRSFDTSFARRPATAGGVFETFLAIRLGPDAYALRLSEIAGLFADRPVSPTPSDVRELVGVAGFRGEIVPVYDLGALLGYPPAPAARWLIVLKQPIALVFAGFDGLIRVEHDAIAAATTGPRAEIVRAPVARTIIATGTIIERVVQKCQHQKEP